MLPTTRTTTTTTTTTPTPPPWLAADGYFHAPTPDSIIPAADQAMRHKIVLHDPFLNATTSQESAATFDAPGRILHWTTLVMHVYTLAHDLALRDASLQSVSPPNATFRSLDDLWGVLPLLPHRCRKFFSRR